MTLPQRRRDRRIRSRLQQHRLPANNPKHVRCLRVGHLVEHLAVVDDPVRIGVVPEFGGRCAKRIPHRPHQSTQPVVFESHGVHGRRAARPHRHGRLCHRPHHLRRPLNDHVIVLRGHLRHLIHHFAGVDHPVHVRVGPDLDIAAPLRPSVRRRQPPHGVINKFHPGQHPAVPVFPFGENAPGHRVHPARGRVGAYHPRLVVDNGVGLAYFGQRAARDLERVDRAVVVRVRPTPFNGVHRPRPLRPGQVPHRVVPVTHRHVRRGDASRFRAQDLTGLVLLDQRRPVHHNISLRAGDFHGSRRFPGVHVPVFVQVGPTVIGARPAHHRRRSRQSPRGVVKIRYDGCLVQNAPLRNFGVGLGGGNRNPGFVHHDLIFLRDSTADKGGFHHLPDTVQNRQAHLRPVKMSHTARVQQGSRSVVVESGAQHRVVASTVRPQRDGLRHRRQQLQRRPRRPEQLHHRAPRSIAEPVVRSGVHHAQRPHQSAVGPVLEHHRRHRRGRPPAHVRRFLTRGLPESLRLPVEHTVFLHRRRPAFRQGGQPVHPTVLVRVRPHRRDRPGRRAGGSPLQPSSRVIPICEHGLGFRPRPIHIVQPDIGGLTRRLPRPVVLNGHGRHLEGDVVRRVPPGLPVSHHLAVLVVAHVFPQGRDRHVLHLGHRQRRQTPRRQPLRHQPRRRPPAGLFLLGQKGVQRLGGQSRSVQNILRHRHHPAQVDRHRHPGRPSPLIVTDVAQRAGRDRTVRPEGGFHRPDHPVQIVVHQPRRHGKGRFVQSLHARFLGQHPGRQQLFQRFSGMRHQQRRHFRARQRSTALQIIDPRFHPELSCQRPRPRQAFLIIVGQTRHESLHVQPVQHRPVKISRHLSESVVYHTASLQRLQNVEVETHFAGESVKAGRLPGGVVDQARHLRKAHHFRFARARGGLLISQGLLVGVERRSRSHQMGLFH